MSPFDPITPAPANPRSTIAPPYVDEDPNIALVEQGLEAAEDETRDAVADAYEAAARQSDEPAEALDDIDFTEGDEESSTPELAAMHEDWIPGDEDAE